MWNVWEKENVLARKPECKKKIGRPGCRWVDNIKTDFQGIVWSADWIDVTQNTGKRRTRNEPCSFITWKVEGLSASEERLKDLFIIFGFFWDLNGVKSVMAIFCMIWSGGGWGGGVR